MSQARTLSSDDIRQLRENLASGGTSTVWFTASAVGVPEGRSGKVVAIGDVEEGDFIQVRPAGSQDVLSFSAAEVTNVKPPRKRKTSSPPTNSDAVVVESVYTPPAPAKPAEKKPRVTEGEPKAATSNNRRKPRQNVGGATITLIADNEGQWNVEVSNGKKRVLKPTAVPASAVAQAAKSLHADVADAVEPLLEAAREQQRARVDQLQQELEAAQRMLDELSG